MRISGWSSDVCSSDLRTVEDAQAALDLDGEIDVSGGVDDIQAVLGTIALIGLPQTGGRRGRDRDAAFLFLLHPVHRRGAVMDRSEEHTSELQSLMRSSYAVYCLKKKNTTNHFSINSITCTIILTTDRRIPTRIH